MGTYPFLKKGDRVIITPEWGPDIECWTIGKSYTVQHASEVMGIHGFQEISLIDNNGKVHKNCGNAWLIKDEDVLNLPEWF